MKFITLGPTGSNHEYVTLKYLDFHRLEGRAELELAIDFDAAAQAVLSGSADFMVQCAVHPSCMATMAKFFKGLYAIDTFISPSQELAVVERRIDKPSKSLAVMLPTLDYIDRSRWEKIELVTTVAEVTKGLVDGTYDAGVAYASVVWKYPEALRIVQQIGTVDDVWIVYGRQRTSAGRMLAWSGSPAAKLFGAEQ